VASSPKKAIGDTCYETRIDPLLNAPHKEAKTVPVLINYSVGTSRFEKLPDDDDLSAIRSAERDISRVGFPIVDLIRGKETQRNVPRGITHLHHFLLRASSTPWRYSVIGLINGPMRRCATHCFLRSPHACICVENAKV